MLYEVMKYCRNFFPSGTVIHDVFKIEGGTIVLPDILDNQYFLVEGSVFNDGVYQYPTFELDDEEFEGTVSLLRIPKGFLDLVANIERWNEKNGEIGVFESESFGGYSYKRATHKDGEAITWQTAFKNRLSAYRKV